MAPRKPVAVASKLEPVLIVWEDAQLDTEFDGDAECAPGTVLLNAVGFLVRRTRATVTLAMDMDPQSRKVRFVFSIPAKMVRSVTPLVPEVVEVVE